MNLPPSDQIRALSRPLDPIPTKAVAVLPLLPGIRGVVFDIYGTLIISGSGDIGVTDATQKESALRAILHDLGIAPGNDHPSLTARFVELVQADHQRSREAGIAYPEVEIREIWRDLLEIDDPATLESVAVAYECATNPVWPMPGVQNLLESLHARGLTLGIVSNAQFYTPLLFEAFFQRTLEQLGFTPSLCFFSYQSRQAKPGIWLYEQLRNTLAAQQIAPSEILYVGNDALKDIHPAASLGFRTALFAGDQRSLRLREDHSNLHPPDAVLTDLPQVLALLGP